MNFNRFTFVRSLASVALIFSACSGSGNATGPNDGSDPTDRTVDLSEYETFDARPYRDEAIPVAIRVEHEVPEALMMNRADAGVLQVVQGYRIQVFSSLVSDEANQAEEELKDWWRSVSQSEKELNALPDELGIYNHFKQPLYRIRAGDFVKRADAERLMTYMAGRFKTVFVVPDRVTIRR